MKLEKALHVCAEGCRRIPQVPGISALGQVVCSSLSSQAPFVIVLLDCQLSHYYNFEDSFC